MEIKNTPISDLVEVQPKVFGDERGYFLETFRDSTFKEILNGEEFVQENQSFSVKGVLRGLHFQKGSAAQGKLVRVALGKVFDVAVDIRPQSPTFGHWYSVILDAQKHNMLYIPPGFAHGFYTLEDAIFVYKCTNYYQPKEEDGIIWNDADLNIDWRLNGLPLISGKDIILPTFSQLRNNL